MVGSCMSTTLVRALVHAHVEGYEKALALCSYTVYPLTLKTTTTFVLAKMFEDEEAYCAVCSDGQSIEPNQIVFCERCDLAVHQQCYGVPEIPDGTNQHAHTQMCTRVCVLVCVCLYVCDLAMHRHCHGVPEDV
eukprot:1154124-Pelagomonas_calceolata.AAC.1